MLCRSSSIHSNLKKTEGLSLNKSQELLFNMLKDERKVPQKDTSNFSSQ
jgi:hypothetical protein